jgi:hypothetical protein
MFQVAPYLVLDEALALLSPENTPLAQVKKQSARGPIAALLQAPTAKSLEKAYLAAVGMPMKMRSGEGFVRDAQGQIQLVFQWRASLLEDALAFIGLGAKPDVTAAELVLLYVGLLSLHPFQDGNGRFARALLCFCLLQHFEAVAQARSDRLLIAARTPLHANLLGSYQARNRNFFAKASEAFCDALKLN